ncbi:hypothetical protein B0T20DRAFT_177779 [Sordaria brevicollis]|uniref:rRNA-processing protein FYV7 n=1 Tax=Sordaria brevicollis TaxID=83679 RepID=A0AAE0UDJ0_SORBR|nr:hypothetical protein B0T20DRAFT_177779 [Sordaria brevicollis]
MAPKRARDEDPATGAPDKKKAKHGFRVGPENLPDGAWKRKVTKIKKELITKAKVKKQYAKIKAQKEAEAAAAPSVPVGPVLDAHTGSEDDNDNNKKNDNEVQEGEDVDPPAPIHPSRQILLEKGAAAKAARAEAEAEQQQQQHQTTNEPSSQNDTTEQREEDQQPTTTTTTTQKAAAAAADDQPYVPPPMEIDPNMHPSRLPKRHRKPNYYEKELALAEKKKKAAEERAAEIARREAEKQKRIAERERYRKQMAKARQPGARDGKIKLGRQSGLLLDKAKRIMGQQ